MRYEVQRQDENGLWKPMAIHEDFNFANALLTDKYRRIHDTETGIVIKYSQPEQTDGQKPQMWDLVGMILVADRRLLFIVPCFAAFCYVAGKFL